MTRILRNTARVIPVADDGTCLLLLEAPPARPEPHWCPIGGAIDPGEDVHEAAVRELFEETGIIAETGGLVGPIAQVAVEFSWDGVDFAGESTVFALPLSKDTRCRSSTWSPRRWTPSSRRSGWLRTRPGPTGA
jgi:8-oxo-dGTP pyrophosphatase MutT (NUDIX family)